MWNDGQMEKKRHLIDLQDTAFVFAHPEEDIRGRSLIDQRGTRLGRIHAIYIDITEKTAPFLGISTAGPAGMTSPTFLVPAACITGIGDRAVHISSRTDRSPYGEPYRPEFYKLAPSRPPYDRLVPSRQRQGLYNR